MMRTARRTGWMAAVLVVSGCGNQPLVEPGDSLTQASPDAVADGVMVETLEAADEPSGATGLNTTTEACSNSTESFVNAYSIIIAAARDDGTPKGDALSMRDAACLYELSTSPIDCLNCYVTLVEEIYALETSSEQFTAALTGAAERPNPVDTNATGSGTFSLNSDETELSYSVSASGLSGDVTGAHFHFSADGAAGSGVVVFPITQSVVNDGNGRATAEGTWSLTAADLLNLRLGYIYVNFHTEANVAGEIRGNLNSAR